MINEILTRDADEIFEGTIENDGKSYNYKIIFQDFCSPGTYGEPYKLVLTADGEETENIFDGEETQKVIDKLFETEESRKKYFNKLYTMAKQSPEKPFDSTYVYNMTFPNNPSKDYAYCVPTMFTRMAGLEDLSAELVEKLAKYDPKNKHILDPVNADISVILALAANPASPRYILEEILEQISISSILNNKNTRFSDGSVLRKTLPFDIDLVKALLSNPALADREKFKKNDARDFVRRVLTKYSTRIQLENFTKSTNPIVLEIIAEKWAGMQNPSGKVLIDLITNENISKEGLKTLKESKSFKKALKSSKELKTALEKLEQKNKEPEL